MAEVPKIVADDCFDILTGRYLNRGAGRLVYVCAINESWVVKTESGMKSFQNILEWETWQTVKDLPARKWFAPCHYISPNGRVLIQSRTTPLPTNKYPKQMPAFFCDFKHGNYGLLDGQLVCHDYGLRVPPEGFETKKLQSVKWWSEDAKA